MLNFHAEQYSLTQLLHPALDQFDLLSELKLTESALSHIFQVTAHMLKSWPTLEEENEDLFPSKRFWSEFKYPWKEKKKDWHLMKSEGEGIPFNPVVPLESQMIITIKKVENNNQ